MPRRRDNQRRKHILHQSGIRPPEPEPVHLKYISPPEIDALVAMDSRLAQHYLILMYNAMEGMLHAAQAIWPDAEKVPQAMAEPVGEAVFSMDQLKFAFGWIDSEGNPTDKMPGDGTHCVAHTATLDTEPVSLDTQIPHDGQMHTMSFGLSEGGGPGSKGGLILAIKAPTPDDNALDLQVRDVLAQWCSKGHPAPHNPPRAI